MLESLGDLKHFQFFFEMIGYGRDGQVLKLFLFGSR